MSICIAGVKHLLVALLFIVFTTYNSFAAGTFEDQVYEEFKSSINSDEVYDAALNSFHFKSEVKRQLLKEHLKLLFSNDALVDEFWLELKSLLGRPITNNPNDINLIVKNSALVAMSYVENLSTKGMLRLSANERKEYFMQTYEITNFMDDRTCAAFQFGNDFIDPLKIREVLIDYYLTQLGFRRQYIRFLVLNPNLLLSWQCSVFLALVNLNRGGLTLWIFLQIERQKNSMRIWTDKRE